jgi:chromate reductase, NAD(P)H dehydrogenase (quinone)
MTKIDGEKMRNPKILAFSGSGRRDSYNQKLVNIAADGAKASGSEVTVINLADFPLPLFDEDLEREAGNPENAAKLKDLFIEHDGFLIACPEYNSSITPLLKNTIDWVSRKVGDEVPLVAYKGKSACLMSTSPGGLGGLRGLVHVRSILSNIGVIVLPDQIAVSGAGSGFDENGQLKDEKKQAGIAGLGANLTGFLEKHIS